MDTNASSPRIITLLVLLFFIQVVHAGIGGKIAGRVTNMETGEPLPGANILIEETTLGAAADVNGEYFILNLPPGVYTVRAQVIGYAPLRVVEVLVQSDITTRIDMALQPAVIEGEEVIVVSERPIVELGVANSTNIMSGNELNDLPLLQFKDVLSRQAGIEVLDARGLVVRGAREHEISLTLDGMETRDAIDNAIYTRLNPDAVQEVEIQTGGFSARYGKARAGVINVITKEGGERYSFTLDVRASQPAPKHFGKRWYEREEHVKRLSEEAITEPLKTEPRWVWNNEPDRITGLPHYDSLGADIIYDSWETIAYDTNIVSPSDPVYGGFYGRPYLCQKLYEWRTRPEAVAYGDKPDINANATLGGPVPFLPKTYFFASGRFERNHYLVKAPQEYFQDWGGSLKISSHLSPSLKLVLTGNYNLTSGVNRTDYSALGGSDPGVNGLEDFNPTKVESRSIFESPEQFAWFIQTRATDNFEDEIWPYSELSVSQRVRRQLGMNLTYVLSDKTFLNLSLDYGDFDIRGRYDAVERDVTKTITLVDPADPSYSVTLSGPYAMAPVGYYRDDVLWGGSSGGIEAITGIRLAGSYHNQEDSWATLTHVNASITSQINKYNQLLAGVDFTSVHIVKYEYRNYDIPERHWWEWDIRPQELAAYLEDKLEFKGMIATFGLRADFAMDDDWYDVEEHPFQPWLSESWMELSEGSDAREYWVVPDDPRIKPIRRRPPVKVALAPRLAISHPLGTKAKIFFNYGHFYQLPDPEKRYYQARRENIRNGSIMRLGNPFIDYEKTVQYEVGYSQSILDLFSIDITGYYRDVSALARLYSNVGANAYSEVIFPPEEPGATPDTIGYRRIQYDTWGNTGFEDIRGIEIRLAKRIGTFFTGSINGSFEVYSTGRYGFRTVYQDTTRDPQYWERNLTQPSARPKLNINANFHTPSHFGPTLLGGQPLADISLSLLFWLKSQPKQDYNEVSRTQEYLAFQNIQWKPHYATDLRFTKRFSGMSRGVTPVFYLQISNLFNTKNMFRGVFRGRYDPADGEVENYLNSLKHDEGDRPGDYKQDYLYLPDPEPFYMFLNPRQIFFGLRLEM